MIPALVIRGHEVAALLGRKHAWFYANRAALEKAGFPKKDGLLGGWNRLAVEQWLARRAGVVAQSAVDDCSAALDRAVDEAKARRDAVRHKPHR